MLEIALFLSGAAVTVAILACIVVTRFLDRIYDASAEMHHMQKRIQTVELEIEYAKKFDVEAAQASGGMAAGAYVPVVDKATQQTRYVHDSELDLIAKNFGLEKDVINGA